MNRLWPKLTPEPMVMGSVGHSALDLVSLGKGEEAETYVARCGQLDMVKTIQFYRAVVLPIRYKQHEYKTAFKIHFYHDELYDEDVYYVGELDGLCTMEHPQLEGEWVIERKFTRQVPSNITRRFLLDDQGIGYLYVRSCVAQVPAGLIVEVVRNTNNPMVVREVIPLSSMPYGDDIGVWTKKFEQELVDVYHEIKLAIRYNRFVESKSACHAMGECWYYKLCAEPSLQKYPTTAGYIIQERSHEEEVAERAKPKSS